ncbi:MSLNL protein, partial [Amia calva]|nr:MSLNL protein [Amia calva]
IAVSICQCVVLCDSRLSTSVLQGFTCSGVRSVEISKVKNIVKACRPRSGRQKLKLEESQLTCMTDLVTQDAPQDFENYPPDMLLYYQYNNVQASNCRSYFNATGAADFTIPSPILNKDTTLLENAKECLGITGTTLNSDNVEVLGNMCCTLNGSYIENSDSSILEKLKNCGDLTSEQVASVQNVLFGSNTKYGNTSSWNETTLDDLGILPLYLNTDFWDKFNSGDIRNFLKQFLPKLREDKTDLEKIKNLFGQFNNVRSRRGIGCTAGNITEVSLNDGAFPFGYDVTQFNLCLDTNIVKDNLGALTEKVIDENYENVILTKLDEAYPTEVPEDQVQLLGATSRQASLDQISKWIITKIDTIAALMDPYNGAWDPTKSNAIITKYLNNKQANKASQASLGATELNSIGGTNLCALNISVLNTITEDSLSNAKPLNVSACSAEQKGVIYGIAKSAFSAQRSDQLAYYNLIKSYLRESQGLYLLKRGLPRYSVTRCENQSRRPSDANSSANSLYSMKADGILWNQYCTSQ